MSERIFRFGPIVGKSSYEMAVESGAFKGTEKEYIEREQKIYDEMVKYAKETIEKVKESISGLGVGIEGSWFEKNGVTDLDTVTDVIQTVMGSEVTEGLPDGIKDGSSLVFKSEVVKNDKGEVELVRQIIVEVTEDGDVNMYHRAQVAENGEISKEGWTNWSSFGKEVPDGVVFVGDEIESVDVENRILNELEKKAPIDNPTFTGVPKGTPNEFLEYGQFRNITISPNDLSEDSIIPAGSIYIVYER